MRITIQLGISLVAFLAGSWAQAQYSEVQANATVEATTSGPAAHVYVSNGKQILAYSAASSGKLTPVIGSPFNFDLLLAATNGRYVWGFQPNSVLIESLLMTSTGALKRGSTTNTENYWPAPDCPLTYWNGQGLRVDHAGEDLYNAAIPEDLFCYSTFQSYRINNSNGTLEYQNETDKIFYGGPNLSILGNDAFAYSPNCAAAFGNGPSPSVTVFQRLSNGALATVNAGVAIPAAPTDTSNPSGPAAGYYCPRLMATDPTNHAAMTLYAVDSEDESNYGPNVIATYTADSRGNLTTSSTYKSMAKLPTASDGSCLACASLRMAPSGKLLAAGGQAGVVLYHFNGGNQASLYRTLLAGNSIGTILWDNQNHMYALGTDSKGAGKLWVYTVTPTSVTAAPGSPYSIANAQTMVVQPLK